MTHRHYGTRLVVTCPGCGKDTTLYRSTSGGLADAGLAARPWRIRAHRVAGRDSDYCKAWGRGYARTDPEVREVTR